MGVLARRREKREQRERERVEAQVAWLKEQLAEWRDSFLADGDAGLRKVTEQLWGSGMTDSLTVLSEAWRGAAGRRSGKAFYDDELRRHWVDLDRDDRSEELEKLIRWKNLLSEAESDDDEDGRLAMMWAVVDTKVLLLAMAFDQTYESNYSERIMRDPLQFGVAELGSASEPAE